MTSSRRRPPAALLALIGAVLLSYRVQGAPLDDPRVKTFAQRMSSKHHLEERSVTELLNKAVHTQRVLDAYKRPAESKPWHEYRAIFLTAKRTALGKAFWNQHAATLARAEAKFGVPARIITAIIGVETNYGKRLGDIRVIDALYTLAFHDPKREKFFRRELEEFLLLAKAGHVDPLRVTGSYAGAIGIPQFISSSYRAYAVDFDGDGRRDLVGSPVDAIGSVASYLARHGWQRSGDITGAAVLRKPAAARIASKGYKPHTTLAQLRKAGVESLDGVPGKARAALTKLDGKAGPEYWVVLRNFYAITRYNHSPLYAMAVHQLAEAIAAARAAQGG